MSMRGFREMGWVAAVAGTALGCYMVNLKVASERASLEEIENRIVLAQRDIRVLQTEIGTRGRLEQLESWNVKVLALSAPQAHQFMEGGFQLATLTAPRKTIDPGAAVVLASAPVPSGERRVEQAGDAERASARDLMHVASLKRDLPATEQKSVDKAPAPAIVPVKTPAKPASATSAPATAKKVVAGSAKTRSATAAPAPAPAKKTKPAGPIKSKDVQARQ